MIRNEANMIREFGMPRRGLVEAALLVALSRHGGVSGEFREGEVLVDEIAAEFSLTSRQRSAKLVRFFNKGNRVIPSSLWLRVLYRAAEALAKRQLLSRPTETFRVTKKREWMLTEMGLDEAIKLRNIPSTEKESLPVASIEVQKLAEAIKNQPKPKCYDPIDTSKGTAVRKGECFLRTRGFRRAVVEAYGFRCAVCGLKIPSPTGLSWEVEAAHIVPSHARGRDDIWNGLALCRLHHWAFDVGWFTLNSDCQVQVSDEIHRLPPDCGVIGGYEFIKTFAMSPTRLYLPDRAEIHPDQAAILWHRKYVFNRRQLR